MRLRRLSDSITSFRAYLHLLSAVVVVASGVMIARVGVGRTAAGFTEAEGVASNSFSTKPDWEAPAISIATLVNSLGNADLLRQGDSYQICGNASDGGAPPSGVATLNANVAITGTVVSTGQTAVPLYYGSYQCAGGAYNYRSAPLTANNPLSEGGKIYALLATDGAGNLGTTYWGLTVDNTVPTAATLRTINKAGGTVGKAEVGDKIELTYSEDIHLPSILTGWDGSSTAIVLTIENNVRTAGGDDLVTFNVNLGAVDLDAKNYTGGNSVFGAAMVWGAATRAITVTLTSVTTDNTTVGNPSTATYAPSTVILDRAGNAINSSVVPSEAGQRHF